MKPKSKILIIAGSDSSGGAGIQADIKTITSLGSYAMTAITAITAQNTTGIKSIVSTPIIQIANQIKFTCKDIKPDGVKIGMLHSEQVARKVLETLNKLKVKNIVLDPVMVSTSGVKLINDDCIDYIKKKLITKVSLITPNIPEAQILSGIKIKDLDDMIVSAKIISKMGSKNILLKGGHLKSKYITDVLLQNNKITIFKNKKINNKNTHGTGCSLSSAVTTYLSCGKKLKKSCYLSIKYVNDAIKTAPNYGEGKGPINHLNNIKELKL